MDQFLFGTEQSDTLAGGDGNDNISGYGGNDTLSGNAGADTLDGGLGNDSLRGGEGNDLLFGNEGNDILDGEAGDDTLDGGAGLDIYRFGRGDGHDVIAGFQLSQDVLLFDAGILLTDVHVARENDDLLLTIKDSADSVRVSGWFSFAGNQLVKIRFADGTSWDPAAIERKVTSSNDLISGTASSETLDGGLGDDWLFGNAGNDILYGDAGNDRLDGGDGADTYLFGRGDGQDLIAPDRFADDKLQFTSGITVADVAVAQESDDLLLTIKGSTDSVRIAGYFSGPGFWEGQIRFVDGTSWDVATILRHLTPSDNTIGGTPGNDFLDGGAGNDFLFGAGGDDTLYGGSGDDGLDGGAGADTYIFGRNDGRDVITSAAPLSQDRLQFGGGISITDVEASLIQASILGNDLLLRLKGSADSVQVSGYFWGGASQLGEVRFVDGTSWDFATISRKVFSSDDFLFGTSGADVLDGGLGNDTLVGAEGDDILHGDSGDDQMEGGLGSDKYYFGRSSGHDTVVEQFQNPGDADTVVFSGDIAAQDLIVTRDFDDLVVGVSGSSAQLRISAWFQPFAASRVERFVFGDGTVLSDQGIEAMLDNAPFVANPIADQSAQDNAVFSFVVPADTFADPDIGDTLTLSARLTNGDPLPAWLAFDPATGTFSGTPAPGSARTIGVEVVATDPEGLSASDQFAVAILTDNAITGTEGDDFLFATDAGNEILGLGGNDVLFGGSGNDTLDGGTGNDLLAGSLGDDVYLPGSGVDTISDFGGMDELRLGAGITPDQVERIRPDGSDDLSLRVLGSPDEVRVANWFTDPSFQLEQVVFADGTVWDAATASTLRRLGTEGDDLLQGSFSTGGLLEGRGGNDQLFGGMGNDTLDGGTGSDFLLGGSGNDYYVVDDSGDTVIENPSEGDDTVEASVDYILPDAVENLTLTLAGFGGHTGIGNTLDNVILGNDSYNLIHGNGGDDFIDGGGSMDYLYGENGDDTLSGGTGGVFDLLDGGDGSDTYLYQRGIVRNLVRDSGGALDRVVMAADILPSEVKVRHDWYSGDTLYLQIEGDADPFFGTPVVLDSLEVEGQFATSVPVVEEVVFADGTIWNAATLRSMLITPGETADDIRGFSTDDVLDGLGGDDVLSGMGGNDELYGGTGDDVLDGGMGNDFLQGGVGNDVSEGGAGDDILDSFSGDDTLRGGTGNDTVAGGFGADTYLFERGDGQDFIYGWLGSMHEDSVQFGAGIAPTDVEASQVGGSLLLQLAGTSDQILAAGNFFAEDWDLKDIRFADGTIWDAAAIRAMVNTAPVANPDAVGVGEDATTANLVPALLTNDIDPDFGDTPSIASVDTSGTLGTVAFDAATQTLTYSADAASQDALATGETSTDTFSYAAADSHGETSTAAVTVTVTGVNDAPVASDETFTLEGNFPPMLSGTVLANDSDPDHDTILRVANGGIYEGTYGTFEVNGQGRYTYVAHKQLAVLSLAQGQVGTDQFTYTVTDDTSNPTDALTATAQFTVNVVGVNDAPIALQDFGSVQEDGVLSASGNVLQNDSDFDQGTVLSLVNPGTTSSAYGTLVLDADGSYTYTLANGSSAVQGLLQGESVTELFDYSISDGITLGGAQIEIHLTGVNDAPMAAADSIAAAESAATANLAAALLANDTDPDNGDQRRIAAVDTAGTVGTVSFDASTQTLTYSADAAAQDALSFGQTASDQFTYTVTDLFGGTSTATVAVTVTGVNDTPTLAAPIADQSATENRAFSFQVPGSAFSEVDSGDTLAYSATLASGAALPGWLTFDAATRTFGGTPGDGDLGAISVRVTATDTQGAAGSDVFDIAIVPMFGTEGDDNLLGTASGERIFGLSGNDTLDGAGGADTLVGGAGNDTYIVYNTGDTIIEFAGEGTDTVQSPFDYALGANLENLALTGIAAINGIGNELDNVLTGNSANNNLSAGAGSDTLLGGGGNDTLIGGLGNDTLDGGAGNDSMSGGAGDDSYFVDGTSDVVTENAGEGADTINSSVTRTLGSNFENLILTGASAINGTGNAAANLLRGNAANNTLTGGAGIDVLEGGAGSDTLSDSAGSNNGYLNGGAGTDTLTGGSGRELYIGGTGNDTLSTGNGADIIALNFGDGRDAVNPSTGIDNIVSLGGAGLSYGALTLQKSSNDLILNVGAADRLTFKSWYAGSGNKSVLTLQVVAEAMAGFNPAGGNALLDNKVESFNFQGLVNAFDSARAANPGLSSWALTNGLAQFQLAGSDTAALGGDLAYQYGLNGTLAGVGFNKAQDVLTGAGFGTQAQTLRPLATLQDGFVPLS